jgi:hypothetical protein
MRSTQDAINGIKIYLNNWGILNDKETKVSVGRRKYEESSGALADDTLLFPFVEH